MENRVLRRIRYEFFPTSRERMTRKWYRDDPDSLRRVDYDLGSSSLVLDVGGHKGQWTSDIFSMYCCRTIVFEPVREFADFIMKRFKHNSSIVVHPFGLGDATRYETMGVCGTGSSVFRASGQTERVRIVDVADFIHRECIERIDLMKVNIEGGEYQLLERLIETGLIENVHNLQVQFHRISKESVRQMEEIQNRLRTTHHPTYSYRFVWENWVRHERFPEQGC